MDFFNPVALFFLFTLQGVNLYQMDTHLAHELSGRYVRESISESISANPCPRSFDVELLSTGNPELFFLKNETYYPGAVSTAPRILPVDGQTHLLFTGQLVRAEITDYNAINVHVFNKEIPGERVVEVFRFEPDGTLFYETKYVDDVNEDSITPDNELCQGARYKRSIIKRAALAKASQKISDDLI